MADKCSKFDVGGQAVIEGVMMRSPKSLAVVCRLPGGEIAIREQQWHSIWNKLKFLKWPFFRGGVVLLEALMNGMSALTFSAQKQEEARLEEEVREQSQGEDDGEGISDAEAKAEARKKAEAALNPAAMTGLVVFSVAMALCLFVGLPHLLTWLLGLGTDSVSFHLVDGLFKVLILVAYIGTIGLNKDIRRVFQYHGAEHKTIWAHEKGLELNLEHVRAQSRFHPRCGTSFLVLVILVSILLFAMVLQFPISESKLLDNLLKILIKIPLMFPIAGLAYEGIKLAGKHRGHWLVRGVTTPGVLLQRLTTREPTDDQLEIGILSLEKALWRERVAQEAADSGVEEFSSFEEARVAIVGLGTE